MNNYTIDLVHQSTGEESLQAQMLLLSHFVRNGQNLNFTRALNGKYSAINADFNYSLSNVINSFTTARQNVYSSKHTNTIETEDRPYPRQGNLAIVAVTKDTTQHLKDLGDYTKIVLGDDDDDIKPMDVYIGNVNSSKTEFHTPLATSNVKYALFFESEKPKLTAQMRKV